MAMHETRDMTGTAREAMREVQGKMAQSVDDLKGYAGSADAAIRHFARERPLVAIACAAGIGFLIGRLASRT